MGYDSFYLTCSRKNVFQRKCVFPEREKKVRSGALSILPVENNEFTVCSAKARRQQTLVEIV